jgi:outer membrane PBP1 activator LpoA protein
MSGDASRQNGRLGGRPQSEATRVARAATERFRELGAQHAEELFGLQMNLARGVKVADDSGVYQKPPDNKAIDSILDRTFGKPQASLELTGEVDTHYTIIHEFTKDHD